MSATASSQKPQYGRRSPRPSRIRTKFAQCPAITRGSPGRSVADDAAFWDHLEAREQGRFALEADYLFDTSYPWAA